MQNMLPSSSAKVEPKYVASSSNNVWVNKRPRSDESIQKSYKAHGKGNDKLIQFSQVVVLDLGDGIKTCMDINRISANHFTFKEDDDPSIDKNASSQDPKRVPQGAVVVNLDKNVVSAEAEVNPLKLNVVGGGTAGLDQAGIQTGDA